MRQVEARHCENGVSHVSNTQEAEEFKTREKDKKNKKRKQKDVTYTTESTSQRCCEKAERSNGAAAATAQPSPLRDSKKISSFSTMHAADGPAGFPSRLRSTTVVAAGDYEVGGVNAAPVVEPIVPAKECGKEEDGSLRRMQTAYVSIHAPALKALFGGSTRRSQQSSFVGSESARASEIKRKKGKRVEIGVAVAERKEHVLSHADKKTEEAGWSSFVGQVAKGGVEELVATEKASLLDADNVFTLERSEMGGQKAEREEVIKKDSKQGKKKEKVKVIKAGFIECSKSEEEQAREACEGVLQKQKKKKRIRTTRWQQEKTAYEEKEEEPHMLQKKSGTDVHGPLLHQQHESTLDLDNATQAWARSLFEEPVDGGVRGEAAVARAPRKRDSAEEQQKQKKATYLLPYRGRDAPAASSATGVLPTTHIQPKQELTRGHNSNSSSRGSGNSSSCKYECMRDGGEVIVAARKSLPRGCMDATASKEVAALEENETGTITRKEEGNIKLTEVFVEGTEGPAYSTKLERKFSDTPLSATVADRHTATPTVTFGERGLRLPVVAIGLDLRIRAFCNSRWDSQNVRSSIFPISYVFSWDDYYTWRNIPIYTSDVYCGGVPV